MLHFIIVVGWIFQLPHLYLTVCLVITFSLFSFQYPCTFVTDDDLKEKFLSNLKVEQEPKSDVDDLVKLVEPEPLVPP